LSVTFAAAVSPPGWLFLQQRELNLLLHGIDAVDEHADFVAEVEGSARMLSNDFTGVFVEGVAVVS